jgi:aminoglycoside phosphotransferase family enzyme/predicted kinase
MAAALPEHLSGLLDAAAYPHPVRAVELVQTHVSWVLLTGEYAYKLKRPVNYPFLDMRDAARRLELCREELRLNRRFAASLYLDLCPIVRREGVARMGGAGEVIEHAVRMRQFPREQELDLLVATDAAPPDELRSFGVALADIHASLPCAADDTQWGTVADTRAAIMANVEQAAALEAQHFGTHGVAALRGRIEAELDASQAWRMARRAAGRVRECHGDLHCGNVVRWDGVLQAFDCLEFAPALRWMDVAQEIAFLLADLRTRGATAQAHAFLGGYLAQSGDYAACRGLALYQAHCALVRAKVMALSAQQGAAPGRYGFAEYLATAGRSLAPRHPVLLAVSGLSGSGKSWLATRLAPLLDAVHLQSDVERKRLAGLRATDRSGSEVGGQLYSAATTDKVYAHLCGCAGQLLTAGCSVIIDATFGSRAQRAQLAAVAHRLGLPLRLIECRAPLEVLRQRLRRRAAQGTDASDADEQVLDWQLRNTQALQADEDIATLQVDTAVEMDGAALLALSRRCAP